MSNWHFFPSPETVFAGNEGNYFVPLATADLSMFCSDRSGPVHFLRPRMINGEETAAQTGKTIYPQNWYAFRRDNEGRYQSVLPLSGKMDAESFDPFDTKYRGNSRERFQSGEIGSDALLWGSNILSDWPNSNWNCGRSAEDIIGRPLRHLGELDTVNFCREGTAGSVLLLDEELDLIIQVFHWT